MREVLQELTAPPAQTLRTLQPTSSTVSYTVSTRPVPRTIPAICLHYISILVRVVLGLATVLLLWMKWRVTNGNLSYIEVQISSSLKDWQVDRFAEACRWKYLIPGALVILFLVFRRNYIEESLTVLRGLGIQTSTTSSTYLQTPTTRFIPTTSIQDIFIHEAFRGFEVRFYLVIVVEGEEDVVVVFPQLLPRRAMLEEVWRGARKCLWEGKEKDKGREDEGK
ncbi:hypothetical protein CC86DRAFT_313370 [Ophiobolus disseminans]|uniref:Phosphatidylinositol N-acetylglucosaminyltransferase subunit H conserved domain-containing protein n=1 Tax=Ophiobolus disseminans TaxID=1469910 RepID=A0A6A7AHH8_9PLEO|nr:hypothetical protein CC86DRAFT_313370 [Ophiobolus disseminans]